MIYARPGSTFTAILEGASTGLVGTLGIRIENTDGTNHTPRTTADIEELEPGSGAYADRVLVAPTVRALYVVIWDDGDELWATEELNVTATSPAELSSSLIDELRRLVGAGEEEYEINGTAYWTDSQLAELLAQAARTVTVPLAPEPGRQIVAATIDIPGVIDPDAPGTIKDTRGRNLETELEVAWSVDRNGAVSFAEDVARLGRLYWIGISQDPHGAAAEALESWASAVKLGYDVSIDGQDLSRSQRHEQLLKQAECEREKAASGYDGGIESITTTARL